MDFFRKVDADAYTAQDMPEYPARTLTAHCVMKGIQLGSVAGTLLVAPALKIVRRNTDLTFNQALRTALPRSILGGLALSLGLLAGKAYQGALDIEGVDDRAYRIHHSEGQKKVDKYSTIGGMAGSGAGVLIGGGSMAAIVSFSGIGVTAGIGYYLFEKYQILDEIKKLEKKDQ
eukprot:gene5870-6310_t